jgi:secondary thiamine-phosphate synthase enzyme
MQQHLHEFVIATSRRGMVDFTAEVISWVASCDVGDGLLTLHVRHTSASLIIQENADPAVQSDMERFLERLVPDGDAIYRHTAEGPDDMPSHVRAALTATSLSIPVQDGRPALGTWQGIYLYEHRIAPHRRRVAAHLLGGQDVT